MSSKGKFSLKICKSCIMLSTRPRITFDHKGYCNACQWKLKKKELTGKKERENS